jgi:hypothetical protein
MVMRAMRIAISVLFVLIPSVAAGQTPAGTAANAGRFSLKVAAGATVKDAGQVLSAGVAFSPVSRLDLNVGIERIYIPTRTEHFSDGGFGVHRGGTMTFASGEVRALLFPPNRLSPFVSAGFGAGVSRPNVNAQFPNAVRNDFHVVYAGGGVRIPLRGGFSVLADARIGLAAEGDEGILALWPLRAGVIWRF